MGMKNARKCNNNVRTYTPRSSTTGRRDTKANRAQRQNRFGPVVSDWLGKRISAESGLQRGSKSPVSMVLPSAVSRLSDLFAALPCPLEARSIKAKLSPVGDVMVAIGTCLVLGYGARLALSGQLSAGVLVR